MPCFKSSFFFFAVRDFIHQRKRRATNENTTLATKNGKSLVNEPVLVESVFKEQPKAPETAVAARELKEEMRGKKYSYYYLARTLWYVPLYFLVYFTFYILFLVVRSIVKHLVNFFKILFYLVLEESLIFIFIIIRVSCRITILVELANEV
jgi:hypothetical protein